MRLSTYFLFTYLLILPDSPVLSHEKNHTHPALAVAALELLSEDFYSNDRALVLRGTREEDEGTYDSVVPRFCYHFYNPSTEQNVVALSVCPTNSWDVRTAREQARILWDSAVSSYPSDESFVYLGRVLHLLQDMTSPAHVESDAHGGLDGDLCAGASNTDDFENWGWCGLSNTSENIRLYVDPVITADLVVDGSITDRLDTLLSDFFEGAAALPIDLSADGFIHNTALRAFNYSVFEGRLERTDATSPQPDSELRRMFPSLRRSFLFNQWEIESIGDSSGSCGGDISDEWWPTENPDRLDNGPICFSGLLSPTIGLFHLEEASGVDDSLTPEVWESEFHQSAQNSKPLLELYGDGLYSMATAYGAGLLLLFKEVVLKPQPFSDVQASDWFEPYVRYARLQGVVEGFDDGTFKPLQAVTRAEALRIAYSGSGERIDLDAPDPAFSDVNPSDWFYQIVADAKSKGFIQGTSCGSQSCFLPNEAINRAEAAKVITVLLGVDLLDPSHVTNVDESERRFFSDVREGVDWFFPYVDWMVNSRLEFGNDLGLVENQRLLDGFEDGRFRPELLVSRAEIAKYISNAMIYCRAATGAQSCQPLSTAGSMPLLRDGMLPNRATLGALFEQQKDPTNGNAPSALILPGGDHQNVTGPLTIVGDERDADGDELFYFWSATGGVFSSPEPVNFSTVTWHPPTVEVDSSFRITVVRGDRRGKVASASFTVTVQEGGTGGNAPPSGAIIAPTGSQTGNVLVEASVTDPDGLQAVSVTFVSGGPELLLCGGGAATCVGTNGTFSASNVDPSAYGATEGSVSMELWVEDSTGERAIADTHTFTYAPPSPGPGYTLTVIKQGDGDGTISGSVACPPGCTTASVTIPEGESFTLSAAAAAGSTWVGWAGDSCYGPSDCSYPMFSDRTVRASFGLIEQLTATLTAPGDGDSNASPNTQPTIYFNRPVNLGPNVGDIVLREVGGADIPFTPVVPTNSSNPRQRLVLVIHESFQRGSSYEVLVPAGAVEDDDGNLLPLPLAFTFSIAENNFSNMHLAAYPIKIMEGSETTVSVWFTEPVDYDREIVLSATDPGVLKPGDLGTFVLPAGEVLLETNVDTELSPGNVSSAFTTLQATEASAGTLSRSLEVANYTSIHGTNLGYLASGVFDDQDGDGVFESGERADLLVEVFNYGPSTSTNVVLDLRVLNTTNLRILGGSPHVCNFGTLQSGQYRSCTKTLLADDELPTGTYFIEIDGRSVSGGFLEQALVNVVNNFQPDFQLNVRNITSHPQPPGGIINLVYTGRNEGDGFSLPMPRLEVDIEIEGQTVPLFRTYVDARGDFNNSQSLNLPIVVPPNPGAHPIRARINPSGAQQLPEEDYSNNEATELTLYVAGPSQPPELVPLGGPFAVKAGETLSFTATASDPNGDPLTFSLGAGAPTGASIDATTGAFTWTPECSQGLQSYSVEVIVTDSELTSDSESFVVEVGLQGDLAVTQTVDTPLAPPGGAIEYTISVTNHGPSCSSSVAVTDLFPTSLGNIGWTCTPTAGSTCTSAGSGDLDDGAVSLLSGGTVTYVVEATIIEGISGSVVNTASAVSTGSAVDPNSLNNSGSSTVSLRDVDYGDAPGPSLGSPWSFPTLLAEDGARHGVDPSLYLGVSIDGELDGQPTLAGDGDDLGAAADEDGVTLPAELVPCEDAEIDVVASAPGLLDAWVDFDTDGSWTVPDEQIFTSEPVVAGSNFLTVSVPCDTTPAGLAFARFRLSRTGGLAPTGLAFDGEVEDHSVLVAQVFHSLGVSKSGAGSGTVVGSPSGINCGSDCGEEYPVGSLVTLSAQPDVGSEFTGWTGGPCTGTGFCTLLMDSAYAVTANFEIASFPLQVTLAGDGSGHVASTPAGIDCGIDCEEAFLYESIVTLTATPDAGSTFVGWSHPSCPGTGACTLTIEAATNVTAQFDLQTFLLTVSKTGDGSCQIVSDPVGIDCGPDCSEPYAFGTGVTLTALPEIGTVFNGWSGACTGGVSCIVNVQDATAVSADCSVEDVSLSVTRSGAGDGGVVSSPAGIDCGNTCTADLPHGTSVTLTEAPDATSYLAAWSGGGCSGSGPCTFELTSEIAVDAEFQRTEVTVSPEGEGLGTVSSSPAGIDCGSDCSEVFPRGTDATLNAVAGPGSAFTGWSGVCSGSEPCSFTVDTALVISAIFEATCLDNVETGMTNWTATVGPNDGGGTTSWQASTTDAHSPSLSWFVADEQPVKDQLLVLQSAVDATADGTVLRFFHRMDTVAGSAGGVLEFSVDGGLSWFDILAGDGGSILANPGRFAENGYDGVLGSCCSSPIPNRAAWSGPDTVWERVSVDLSDFVGHQVLLRWRFASDDVGGGQGWWIDDLAVLNAARCPLAFFGDGFESGNTSAWSLTLP